MPESIHSSGSATKRRACRLCGRPDPDPLFTVEGYAIERCPACGLVQVRDEPDPAVLDRIYAALHVKHQTYRAESAARRENERRVDLLRQLLPANAAVLDAGCATGDFLEPAKAVFRMSGMDVSEGAVEVARRRHPELSDRLLVGRIEDWPPGFHGFDAICLWDVIEHLWDPVSACRRMFDHLAPGGLLFLSTPDAGALTAKLMGPRWAFMIPPEHLSLFAAKSFRHLFEAVIPGEIVQHVSQGKWTNVAFLVYKLNRMAGNRLPKGVMDWAARSALGKTLVYIPTGDIQYLAVRKPAGNGGGAA
jgi:2-polyprenyl-3-methyl-5-hydroxy-6-metoxy-1,4-benzoquinol methylase